MVPLPDRLPGRMIARKGCGISTADVSAALHEAMQGREFASLPEVQAFAAGGADHDTVRPARG